VKRVIAIAVVLIVAGLVTPGHSRGRTERTETLEYVGASGVNVNTVTAFELVRCAQALPGCVAFETTPKDRWMTVEIEDATGGAVFALASQEIDTSYYENICSKSKTFKIGGGLPVYVWVLTGVCEDNTPSTVTTGTVTATFSNMR
jgi:hypothetical protein